MNEVTIAINKLYMKANEFFDKANNREYADELWRYCSNMGYALDFLAELLNHDSSTCDWTYMRIDFRWMTRFEKQCIKDAENIFMECCCNIPTFPYCDQTIIQLIDDNVEFNIYSNEFILFLLNKMERKPQKDRFEI